MKAKVAILLAVLALGIFLAGCEQQSNYPSYNQQQGQQQGQYVGGGCGVAPAANYENTPIGSLDSKENSL